MKLYVGNLSWGTDEDRLRSEFEQFGDVEFVRVVTDRETGRSRGFGFVTFTNNEDAEKAIEEMNGKDVDGRTIKVNEARERSPRGGGGGGGGGGGRGNSWGGNQW